MKFFRNVPLKKLTTLAIGGPAKYFISVKTPAELKQAVHWAKEQGIGWEVIGDGSNLVPYDRGYDGLVIQNKIEKFDLSRPSATLPRPGEGKGRGRTVVVGAGDNLLKLIFRLNRLGLSGLERMAGIPGTVGGAVYGSAGAYGQEIQQRVLGVRIYDAKHDKFQSLSKKHCGFGYRTSIFKRNKHWIITEVRLKLGVGEGGQLMRESKNIIKLREIKYKPGLLCPGSFFMNLKLDDLPKIERQGLLKQVPVDKVMYGKIPAGYLLERVGAKGMRRGRIKVALHHANLIYNSGGGKAADIVWLAQKLKGLVKKRFGVKIVEEVQYLG